MEVRVGSDNTVHGEDEKKLGLQFIKQRQRRNVRAQRRDVTEAGVFRVHSTSRRCREGENETFFHIA